MNMQAQDIENRIRENIEGVVTVKAQDLTGTGDHWQIKVVAESFTGQSMVKQHQAIYKALGEWMHGPIHALSIDSSIP
jgi:stress-induced morphogen